MIIDTLAHAAYWRGLLPGLGAAFDFLGRPDLASLPDGRVVIDGERVFALVQSYETKPVEPGRLEAHRRYADVQVLLAGEERFGYAPLESLSVVTEPYDAARDIAFFAGACDFVTLSPGRFALVLPHDAHLPGRHGGSATRVRKVVVKVAV